jgi:diadenosine tetraphosphatase ApaH/serine/threonine PP2A family protein phosphatase
MRIAIISDIHSNLEALERALAIIKTKQVDEIVCLGDIIGYGANPNECIALVKGAAKHILLGNHDEAAIDLEQTEYFNPFARLAAGWTHKQLTPEHQEFIKTLPYTAERAGVRFVHSSPFHPEEWNYIISPSDAQFNFAYFPEPICFVGHSHVAGLFPEDIWTREVIPGKKFIVNVGSIGQPRDNDWRLSFGIFDSEAWTYENVRAEYDVQTASAKIRDAGLPRQLADRILVGR